MLLESKYKTRMRNFKTLRFLKQNPPILRISMYIKLYVGQCMSIYLWMCVPMYASVCVHCTFRTVDIRDKFLVFSLISLQFLWRQGYWLNLEFTDSTLSGFKGVFGLRIPMFVWQALYPQCHLPSPNVY